MKKNLCLFATALIAGCFSWQSVIAKKPQIKDCEAIFDQKETNPKALQSELYSPKIQNIKSKLRIKNGAKEKEFSFDKYDFSFRSPIGYSIVREDSHSLVVYSPGEKNFLNCIKKLPYGVQGDPILGVSISVKKSHNLQEYKKSIETETGGIVPNDATPINGYKRATYQGGEQYSELCYALEHPRRFYVVEICGGYNVLDGTTLNSEEPDPVFNIILSNFCFLLENETIAEGSCLNEETLQAIKNEKNKHPELKNADKYIAYQDKVKVGGTLAWRANNPGNLGEVKSKIAVVSREGGIDSVFRTMEDGRNAQRNQYLSPKYESMTVREAVGKHLTPPWENDTTKYLQDLEKQGVNLDATMKSQIDKLMAVIPILEGVHPNLEGIIVNRVP